MNGKFKNRIFIKIEKVIRKNEKSFFLFFLYLFSLLFKFIVNIRNFLYEKKIISQTKVKPFVVSIGNIVAGGVGKTPITILLAKAFYNAKVGIITRGYKSKFENKNKIIFPKDKHSWKLIGDEPSLIKKKIKDAYLFIGKNRLISAKKAEKENLDLLILDDGLQYRKLHKDIEVIVLNNNNLFGNNHFLPRGFLRDNPKRLKEADLIIVNNANIENDYKKTLKTYSKAPIVCIKPSISKIFDIDNNELKKIGPTISIFCSIGDPQSFYDMMINNNFKIVDKLFFSDHYPFSLNDLISFSENSIKKGAERIVCTYKDFVKIDKNLFRDIPIACIDIDSIIISGKKHWDNLVEIICQNVYN